jgi:hypothetical protein
MSKSTDLFLTASHRRITLTSAQPLGSRSPVLSHRHVQLSRSLSHCVSQENHLEYHIISTLCTEENNKPITWAPSPLTGVHIVSSQTIHPSHGHLPFSGAHNVSSPSQRERHTQLTGFPTQGHTTFHLCLREESHTQAHNIPSLSQRGTTHPTHGLPHPTQGTQCSISVSERNHTPNSWASSPHTGAHKVPSPSQRGTTHPTHGHTQLMGFVLGRLTQSVSWRMSHAAVIINIFSSPYSSETIFEP